MDSSMFYAKDQMASTTEANVVAHALANASGAATSSPRVEDGGVSMNNFYPALIQCFGIIICGLVDSIYSTLSHASA